MNMDHRACNIARCQPAANLYRMPARLRPRGCQSAGKNAGSGRTPDSIAIARAAAARAVIASGMSPPNGIGRAPVRLQYSRARA
jgi:hypothetical protein